MSLLEIKNLSQRLGGRDILKDVNLSVERGEVFTLIGPTGAGKTTLLRLIDLIDWPTSGEIYFDGIDTARTKARLEIRRRLAFVLQKPVVFNTTVYENIAYGLKWRGLSKNNIHTKVSGILDMVGLSAFKNRNARTLSGGEVQRVAIARAIVTEPEMLLLDEPTANLDPVSTTGIEELITDIIKKYETTIVMASHDMSQSQRLADRVGVLLNGEIQQTGDWRSVFYSPQNREVASFVGSENIIDGVVVSSQGGMASIDIRDRTIEAVSDYSAGERVSVCIRPEEITLATSKPSSSARNSLPGKVTRIVSLEPLARIEIDCGFPLTALLTKRSVGELGLEKGRQVYASFKATGVHLIKKEGT